ncbi:peptidylprolyl isomerase [Serratia microhaemolytica]|uniref:peptidylprolyl isomerase n=1 Tax=Serratia microhaemolytica TaxID=2675110 RepID=UPI000FDDCC3C|nr:peptidylprolyl isomerase [Serratia microhaemolytica]
MMDNLRAAANHVVLKIILGLIVLSFVLTGVGNYLIGGSSDYAAKVNGQVIGRAQLEQAFQSERNTLQQQLGDQFSMLASNEGYMQQLRYQVLSQLIDKVLLDQYAKQLSLNISDEQVKAAIRQEPYFQTDGRFDNAKYLELIGRLGYSAENYAQSMRQQLINQQMIEGFSLGSIVPPNEAQAVISLLLQQRDVRLATLDLKAIEAKQSVSDEELSAYYDQNKNSFLAPEQVKVSYILLDANVLQQNIQIAEADIAAYYAQHQSSFGQPEQKKFRIIQLASEAEAQAVLKMLQNGADFAKLAKEKSTDIISKRNGGALDWMTSNEMSDELKLANLTEKGQLSAVISSSVGYLIVRLDEIKAPVIKPLSEVHAEITQLLKREKALDAFYALQQKINEAVTSDNESLASAEEAAGLKAVQTEWFTRDNVPEVLNYQQVVQAIFSDALIGDSGSPGNNSDIISVEGDRALVLRVVAHQPEEIEPFDKVKSRVLETVKRNKALQQARLQAEKLLVELNQGKGEEAIKAAGLTFAERQTMSREQADRQLSDTIFSLAHPAAGKVSYGLAQDSQGNIVIIALDAVKPGELPADKMNTFMQQMENNAANVALESLLANLRKDASIKMGITEQSPR